MPRLDGPGLVPVRSNAAISVPLLLFFPTQSAGEWVTSMSLNLSTNYHVSAHYNFTSKAPKGRALPTYPAKLFRLEVHQRLEREISSARQRFR